MEELVPVPGAADGSEAFSAFAHTYDGYELHGGMEGLAALAGEVRERWRRDGGLGEDVDALRACLFLEARAFRHGGFGRFERDPFVAALVARIGVLSGGFVPVKGAIG